MRQERLEYRSVFSKRTNAHIIAMWCACEGSWWRCSGEGRVLMVAWVNTKRMLGRANRCGNVRLHTRLCGLHRCDGAGFGRVQRKVTQWFVDG